VSSPIVELRNVSKTFLGSYGVTALSNVSFQLQAGERVAVVGRSGSGKSTLLAISGSLERASGGDVLILGQRLSDLPDRAIARLRGQRIGFVFQSFHLLQRLTALENVAEALMYGGVRGPQREARAATLLERVGLGDRASHYPHQLSGGEQQRVAIARAIANEPALLIADEPTGDLDPESGREVVSALLESGASRAVLVATHVPEVAAQMERQLQLVGGRLIAGDG
jgi:putative ABC transport system ATP-binding protein